VSELGQDPDQPGRVLHGRLGAVGRPDSGTAVTNDYPGELPWHFTGSIRRVVVDVCGQPYVDLERQADAMLARE
jgi:hypothetical protein